MDSIPKVSVIIPVYNVEKYVERCVRSLFGQTLDDIEYIFVNDSTPDKSIEIIEQIIKEFPQRESWIKIIHHPKNMGSAVARNTGLQAITGMYSIQCDADDWVEPDMYETMYNKALEENADIVGCNFEQEYFSYKKEVRQFFPVNPEECLAYTLSGRLHGSTWNKLVRTDLYTRYNIAFPVRISCWEDITTILQLYYYSRKISYIPCAFYHYVQYNNDSILHKNKKKNLEDMIIACGIIHDFLLKQQAFDKFQLDFVSLVMRVKIYLILQKEVRDNGYWHSLWPEFDKDLWKKIQRRDIRFAYRLALQKKYNLIRFIFWMKEKCEYLF